MDDQNSMICFIITHTPNIVSYIIFSFKALLSLLVHTLHIVREGLDVNTVSWILCGREAEGRGREGRGREGRGGRDEVPYCTIAP